MLDNQLQGYQYLSVLQDEEETKQCAVYLAQALKDVGSSLPKPLVFHFRGEIGAGKSCFIRALLKALGVTGTIKSPTFSIIESYAVAEKNFSHMDLYRLEDEEELHYLGFEEHVSNSEMVFIEWPEKVSFLPMPDLFIHLEVIEFGAKRKISIQSNSKQTQSIVCALG